MEEIFFAGFDDFRLRMVDGPRLERNELAISEHFIALLEVFFHERQVPPPAVEPRRAIVQDKFEHRPVPVAPAFDAEGDDLSARRGCLAQPQISHGPNVSPVLVAPGSVKAFWHSITIGFAGKLGCAFGADTPQPCQRDVERIGRRFGHGKFVTHRRLDGEAANVRHGTGGRRYFNL